MGQDEACGSGEGCALHTEGKSSQRPRDGMQGTGSGTILLDSVQRWEEGLRG